VLWASSAALATHVLRVGLGGAWKQMRRIHAGWVVARMAHVDVIGKWTVVEYPRKTVSANNAPFVPTAVYYPVSAMSAGTTPQPTSRREFNVLPKAGFHWHSRWWHVAMITQ
jgi:hypothetical protein